MTRAVALHLGKRDGLRAEVNAVPIDTLQVQGGICTSGFALIG